MRVRYMGSDDARDLAIRGGFVTFPRGKWVDVEKEAESGGIPPDHAVIVARALADQPDWEIESKTTPAKGKES